MVLPTNIHFRPVLVNDQTEKVSKKEVDDWKKEVLPVHKALQSMTKEATTERRHIMIIHQLDEIKQQNDGMFDSVKILIIIL